TAIAQVITWQSEFQNLRISQCLTNLIPGQGIELSSRFTEEQSRLWSETRNLLDIAYLILKSALFRTESRGGHYRLDYPQTSPPWQVHTLVRLEQWWQGEIGGYRGK
ncbi:MAG: L-aspartate oxidase, partial [Microcystaceae cyanobacterium]